MITDMPMPCAVSISSLSSSGVPKRDEGCPLKVKMRKFINYLKESFVELTKKTTWPTWDKLQSSALLVMVTTAILALALWVIDLAFQSVMTAIYTL